MTLRDTKTLVASALCAGLFAGPVLWVCGPWVWTLAVVLPALWLLADQARRERREP